MRMGGSSVARSILGTVAGVITAGIVVLVIELAGMAIYPPPAGMNPADPETIRTHLAAMPIGAFLAVLAAWASGALLGTWVAGRISGSGARWPGLVAGAIFAAACAFNLVALPHPIWFAIAALILVPAAVWLGTTAGSRLRPAPGRDR